MFTWSPYRRNRLLERTELRNRTSGDNRISQQDDFVSAGDTSDIRTYQRIVSEYQPYSYDELRAVSRKFIRGRNASIKLDMNSYIDDALSGDWSEQNIRDCKEKIIDGYRSRTIDLKENGKVPKDITDAMTRNLDAMSTGYVVFVQSHQFTESEIRRLTIESQIGDEALEDMVNHNLQLAMSRVGKVMRRSSQARDIGMSELIGVANVGLILGARQYDPDSGNKFSTYAAYHIDGQLYDYVNAEDGNAGIIVGKPNMKKQIAVIRQVKCNFRYRYGREPTAFEIHSLTGMSLKTVEERMTIPQLQTQSIYVRGADGSEMFLPDMIESGKNVERDVSASADSKTMSEIVSLLDTLPRSERSIVEGVLGFNADINETGHSSLNYVAKKLGIAPREAKALYQKGIERMRKQVSSLGITAADAEELLSSRND